MKHLCKLNKRKKACKKVNSLWESTGVYQILMEVEVVYDAGK